MHHILFIHSSLYGHFGCIYLLDIVKMLLGTLVNRYLVKNLLSILLGIYPRMELLGRMVIACLIF